MSTPKKLHRLPVRIWSRVSIWRSRSSSWCPNKVIKNCKKVILKIWQLLTITFIIALEIFIQSIKSNWDQKNIIRLIEIKICHHHRYIPTIILQGKGRTTTITVEGQITFIGSMLWLTRQRLCQQVVSKSQDRCWKDSTSKKSSSPSAGITTFSWTSSSSRQPKAKTSKLSIKVKTSQTEAN